jgi:uncharacterized protein YbjT (DUF2867 family)
MGKTAVIIGATGATGRELIQLLLSNNTYDHVKLFLRKSTGIEHHKLEEHCVDFNQLEAIKQQITGDVLFSCLGTTMAIAKSKENQFEVDYTYQYEFANLAAENGIKNYVLISSIGANAHSMNFYLSMKGKLDEAVKKLDFNSCSILRPGPIDAQGKRTDQRSMENSSINVLRFVNKLGLFKKYQPITTQQLAQAMINAQLNNPTGYTIYEALDIFELLKK